MGRFDHGHVFSIRDDQDGGLYVVSELQQYCVVSVWCLMRANGLPYELTCERRQVEMNGGVICASAPLMARALRHHLPKIKSYLSKTKERLRKPSEQGSTGTSGVLGAEVQQPSDGDEKKTAPLPDQVEEGKSSAVGTRHDSLLNPSHNLGTSTDSDNSFASKASSNVGRRDVV